MSDLSAVVTRTQTTIVDSNNKEVYHETAGNEDIAPLWERHKTYFRRLAELCRAMTDEPIKVNFTVIEEDIQNDR